MFNAEEEFARRIQASMDNPRVCLRCRTEGRPPESTVSEKPVIHQVSLKLGPSLDTRLGLCKQCEGIVARGIKGLIFSMIPDPDNPRSKKNIVL